MTLIPAYGREYKSKKEVEADFNADKDFIICEFANPYNGKPANKSDLKNVVKQVTIRYGNLRKVAILNTGGGE